MVHTSRETLRSHPGYELAKKQRDARAATRICNDLARENLVNELWDSVVGKAFVPIVVAPSMPIGDTNNALGRGFAAWLARELHCEPDASIYQTNLTKRDQIRSPFHRLANSPTYGGIVVQGAHYIIADDLYTLGGTLACLRGFILARGGNVLRMTTLAERSGKNVQISLADETALELNARYGDPLTSLLHEQSGFDTDCLTEAEGRYLLEQPSFEQIRAGFARARDCGA